MESFDPLEMLIRPYFLPISLLSIIIVLGGMFNLGPTRV